MPHFTQTPRCGTKRRRLERAQSMAEFAIVMPILLLLFLGMAYAANYAMRAVSADLGVFATGVAQGSYKTPASGAARDMVLWSDIQSALRPATLPSNSRQVRSRISLFTNGGSVLGAPRKEVHNASAWFRLWRFYAGPPEGDIQ